MNSLSPILNLRLRLKCVVSSIFEGVRDGTDKNKRVWMLYSSDSSVFVV